mgnify:CR=1 FL=1
MTHTTTQTVRVRFAPSPTGHLHIGGVRTALFNWLFARHHQGTYVVRIEDTDRVRSTQEAEASQLASLAWLGLSSDEEPVRQSERFARHKEVVEQLRATGRVYEKEGATWFRVARDTETLTFHDLIRGDIVIPADMVDDFVVCRSDGSPVYNFVVVIDDHDMEISHVIRGEDHISNTFRQILLYQALGWNVPQFAHLPLIMGASGAPLSKRDGVTDVTLYKHNGYVPHALINYLVRLGWSHKDQEVFSREELVSLFTLSGVGKKSAVFDMAKLNWLNQHYIKDMTSEQLLQALYANDLCKEGDYLGFSQSQFMALLDLYKTRSVTLTQLKQDVIALAASGECTQPMRDQSWIQEGTIEILKKFVMRSGKIVSWDKPSLLAFGKALAKEAGTGLGAVGKPLRYCITQNMQSPGIFDIISILGRSEALARINQCITSMGSQRED